MTTAQIASWVALLDSQEIPDSTFYAARRSLYNYLGCALNGSAHPSVSKAFEALQPLFGKPTSTIFGTTHQSDAQHAALLNGIASHVHDYDDTHLQTIIHPTGPVASALLAYIQHVAATSGQTVDGKSLLVALIAGIEVECKLGLSVYPRHYDTGWHITSTTGSIGAAVAVSKLMNLTQAQIINSIGIAATQVTGLRSNFGSDTKSFHIGRAAQNGLLAALLAQHSFTSHSEPLEAKRGWANVVTGGADHNDDIGIPNQLNGYISELGQIWEIEKNAFKPFPCGIVAHPAIDAAIQMRAKIIQETGSNNESSLLAKLNTLKFKLRVHPLVVELTNNKTPHDGLQAKFSVYHGIAVGLIYGKAGPAEYEDAVVQRAEVIRIRDAIEAKPQGLQRSDETVMVAFENEPPSPAYSVYVEHALGSLDVPMTDEQLTEKFVDQVALVLGRGRAEGLSEVCWGMGEVGDVSEVLGKLGK